MNDKIIANGLLRCARNDDVDRGKGSGFLRLRRKKPDHLPQNDRHCEGGTTEAICIEK